MTRNTITATAIVLLFLSAVWFYGGNYVKNSMLVPQPTALAQAPPANKKEAASGSQAQTKESDITKPAGSKPSADKQSSPTSPVVTGQVKIKDSFLTDPVPSGRQPQEPRNPETTEKAYTCTLSVVCNTILDNIDSFNKDKLEVLPQDGIVFTATNVPFFEGESVFNVLQREMKQAGISMEFESTPLYNSNYIEGINNIYEFDCGELSGWMYRVNGLFPNYGCSRYQLKDGDEVDWVYTCDLGRDIGGNYTMNRGGGS